MNKLSNQTCIIELFSASPNKIVLNALRLLIAFLYIFWILMVIRVKNLQHRGMAFLYNLAVNGLFYASVGIYYSTWSSCYYPSKSICYLSSFLTTYCTYYSGYAIGGLILYRLLCITHPKWTSNLSFVKIAISIAVVWIFPILCSLMELFVFSKEVSFKPKALLCSNEYHDFYAIIIFFAVFGVLFPNGIIVLSYFASLIYLKRLRKRASNTKSIEPPRITIQIIVYITLYALTCVLNLVAAIPLNFPGVIIPINYLETFFYSVRLINWIRHILPLGLMYFNAELLKNYKKFLRGKCCN